MHVSIGKTLNVCAIMVLMAAEGLTSYMRLASESLNQKQDFTSVDLNDRVYKYFDDFDNGYSTKANYNYLSR